MPKRSSSTTTSARRSRLKGGEQPAPSRSSKYELRQAEVLEIAASVFAERGYHATSIQDLVDATQLQRGGLYYYIGGKKELLLEIHRRVLEPLLQQAREAAAREGPADVALRDIARTLMRTINSSRDLVTVFLHEWRVIENDPDWADVRKGRRQYQEAIAELLERGRRDGIFAFDDLRLTQMAFLGMMNYTYRWLDPRGRLPTEEVADRFCDLFLKAIAA